jgi:hypothetical protein
MTGLWSAVLLLLVAAPEGTAATHASVNVNPRAIELFERDWVLMDWGLRFHDRDRNAELSIEEATKAAEEFKKFADGDGDGRVTPAEFREGRAFLLARY